MTKGITVIASFGVLLMAVCLVPLSVKLFSSLIPRARRWGLVDRPGGRHIHATPVAIVGGLGVIATWLIGWLVLAVIDLGWAIAHAQEIGTTVFCALVVLGIGLADDRHGITPKMRLSAELAVAVATVLYVPSVHDFCASLAQWIGVLVYPLVAVSLLGVMNAMNLVDGLDGLAGSMFLSLAAAVSVLSLPLHSGAGVGGVSALLLIPGLLAFLRKNWNPAMTFMGDHGSLCIGYLLAVAALGIHANGVAHSPADIVLLAALFSYPVLDMMICMFRRLRAGQPVATGDRNHMHHRMLRLGLSARESVAGLIGWQLAMLAPVFLIRSLPAGWSPLVLLTSVAVAAERLLILGRIEAARIRQYQTRAYALLKPRGLAQMSSSFVRAQVCIPLRPIFEAAQFEERGCLDQMIESLRFFCERKVKGHGFVQLVADSQGESGELVVSLVGPAESASSVEELHAEWADALKIYSQAFRLTYSTWNLPVKIRVPSFKKMPEKTIEVA